MIDYSRYYRAYAEMKQTLDGDYAEGYLTGAMSDANDGKDDLSGNAYNRVIDMEWVEKIEEILPYMDKAIREDRKFIEEYKEVDRIDKVKQVGKDAVQHLSMHTNLIQNIDDDGFVNPSRLLNTHREDSYATYENRFLYTLIYKTIAFVEARFRALQEAPNDSSSSMSMSREVTLNNQKFSFSVSYASETHDRDKISKDEDISSLTDYERIERIRMMLTDFVGTNLIQSLKGCIQVKSPINKTNCIKKNPNFSKCYDLWTFIEAYRKTGYVLESNEYSGEMPENVQKEIYDVMAFQHFVMTISTNKALKDKLQAEYEAENKRREAEANKPEEELARYIEEQIYEARREEMAIRLKEVRERELIIAQLTAELEQEKEKVRLRDLKIAELQSLLDVKERELAETKEQLRQALQRVAELEAELEVCKARIAELEEIVRQQEETIAAQAATIASLEATIAELNATIDALNATIEALKAEIEEHKAHIAQLEETVKSLEATVAEQQTQIAELNANVNSLQASLNAAIVENDSLKATIDQHEHTIADQKAEIADKSSMLATANDQVNNLSTQLGSLQTDFDDLKSKYENHQAEIDSLNATIADGNAQNDELNHQIRVHLNMLSAKDAIISTLNEEKSAMQEKITQRDDVVAKNKAETDLMRDKFSAIESENVALNNTMRTQVAAIMARDEKIASLQAAVDDAQADKNRQLDALTADYEAKLEAIRRDYEAKLAQKEQEKLAACTFTDEQKYSVRLSAEKKSMQAEYDKQLALAKKKAKAYVRKARVLVDDKPDKLLALDETKDYN